VITIVMTIVMAVTPAFMAVAVVMAIHADFAMHAMLAAFAAIAVMIAVADTNFDIGLGELDAVRRRAGGKTRGGEREGGRSGQRESKRFHVHSSWGWEKNGFAPLSFAPTTQEGSTRSAETSLSI
jgi:hypothetical protein